MRAAGLLRMLVAEVPVEPGRDGLRPGEAEVPRHRVVVRHELDVDENLLLVDPQLVDVHRNAGEVLHETLDARLQLLDRLHVVHAPREAHLAPRHVHADVGDVRAPQEVSHELADLRGGVRHLRDDPRGVEALRLLHATERVHVGRGAAHHHLVADDGDRDFRILREHAPQDFPVGRHHHHGPRGEHAPLVHVAEHGLAQARAGYDGLATLAQRRAEHRRV